MNKRNFYKLLICLIAIVTAAVFIFAFSLYWAIIIKSLTETEGLLFYSIIVVLRISVLLGITIYSFRRFFRQERIFLSDVYFLFGVHFFVLTVGKVLDLFSSLIYFHISDELYLIITKIRYILIILLMFPLLFLGLGIILLYLKETREKDWTEKKINKIRIIVISTIVIVESLFVILAPTLEFLILALPFIVILSLIGIDFMFFFAYKHKRLSQVHPLIIAIGFTLYTISSILRPLIAIMAIGSGGSAYVLSIIEVIDLVIYIIIFIGFISKPKYAKI